MVQVEITWDYKKIGTIVYSEELHFNETMTFKYDGIDYTFKFHLNTCMILYDTFMLSDINNSSNWINITLIK